MPTVARALLVLAVALTACHRTEAPPAKAEQPGHGPFVVQDWPLPVAPGAAEPDLVAAPDGRLLLGWISSVPGRRNALQFSDADADGRWQTAPRTIAVGNTLLANWANAPHLLATPDGALWVHWLQAVGAGEATNLALARSTNDGFSWSAPLQVNPDGEAPAEHGFAALWPASQDTLGMAWLAGGAEAADAHAAHGAHAGATALRAAVFDRNLQRSAEQVVDARACDCCRTAVAMTARGPLLVYRDRSDAEVRDIAATRFDGHAWSKPVPVHADGWKMAGCPVNGPAIAARGNDAVVGWYTGAQDKPAVLLARTRDAGDHFDAPVAVDAGEQVDGRVALALDAQQAWVAWLRADAGGSTLWLSRYATDLSHELQRFQVAKLHARGPAAGYPQLAVRADGAWLVWTDSIDGVPQLRGAHVTR
ncbi:MAG TPA: sialidase family protein [Xanthomonadaceae bacterium]|nr:sialidase family protein [Xanthomonadaceae bacterium]